MLFRSEHFRFIRTKINAHDSLPAEQLEAWLLIRINISQNHKSPSKLGLQSNHLFSTLQTALSSGPASNPVTCHRNRKFLPPDLLSVVSFGSDSQIPPTVPQFFSRGNNRQENQNLPITQKSRETFAEIWERLVRNCHFCRRTPPGFKSFPRRFHF